MIPKSFFATALLIILLFSCKKNNESSGITYKIKTTNRSTTVNRANQVSPGDVNIIGRTMGIITWTSGFASATEIQFEAENENSEVEFESEARQRINLFSPLATLGNIPLPPGSYKEVEFQVELSPTATEPALELRGEFNGIPVVFRINSALEIESELENITITQANDYNAIITMNLSLLTLGISETALNNASLTNGEIIISGNSNTALYNIMIANLSNLDEVEFED